MAATVTITDWDFGERHFEIYGTITLTGNYGTAGSHGDTLSFLNDIVKSNQAPVVVEINEAPPAGTAANGYIFTYNPGTSQNTGVLQILNNLAEYTPGSAYSPGLLAATIVFRAVFQAFV